MSLAFHLFCISFTTADIIEENSFIPICKECSWFYTDIKTWDNNPYFFLLFMWMLINPIRWTLINKKKHKICSKSPFRRHPYQPIASSPQPEEIYENQWQPDQDFDHIGDFREFSNFDYFDVFYDFWFNLFLRKSLTKIRHRLP